ncbi:GNAT family N-acetyltransferase [Alloprevotella tannerae]|uniref:GNAT family N-acetyltransferase n=1 Tax=Alloprevotella tannerae TaxID=76122 RepID=UPI0028E84102|nr:GNAT family N-acetyltransferase [Alloprevotella tannerae]
MIRKFAPQEDLDQATMLYVTSFPEEERRETTLWQKMVCKLPHMTTYTILYKESFAGFFTFWDFHNFVYGEHFAIDPLLRRKNIGGQALEGIIKVLNKPLIIEVEPKGSNPMANRRIDFYIRHGLKLSNRPYLQPPYHEHGKSIPLQLMATDSVFLEENYHTIVRTIHKEVYQKCFTFPKG